MSRYFDLFLSVSHLPNHHANSLHNGRILGGNVRSLFGKTRQAFLLDNSFDEHISSAFFYPLSLPLFCPCLARARVIGQSAQQKNLSTRKIAQFFLRCIRADVPDGLIALKKLLLKSAKNALFSCCLPLPSIKKFPCYAWPAERRGDKPRRTAGTRNPTTTNRRDACTSGHGWCGTCEHSQVFGHHVPNMARQVQGLTGGNFRTCAYPMGAICEKAQKGDFVGVVEKLNRRIADSRRDA